MIEVVNPKARLLVSDDATIECIASGFLFTEGPLWDPRNRGLIFSDIQGDVIHRWTASSGVSVFRRPSRMANGNAWDLAGRLLTCEHATSRVVRAEENGNLTVLASHYRGKALNSPNDLVVAGDGAVYFTDPDFGRRTAFGIEREPELPHRGVYRIDPPRAEVRLLVDDFAQPNGLCFSPDESLLYVNDSARKHVRLFSVRSDGSLRGGRLFAELRGEELGAPDGMKIDNTGNLYCTGPGGIHVFAPDGSPLLRIRTPEPAANFAFGDGDYRTLYITARTSLYRMRMGNAGKPQMPGSGHERSQAPPKAQGSATA